MSRSALTVPSAVTAAMTLGARDEQWICCHLGAREHYAVPRSLYRQGRLRALITDAWVDPGSVFGGLPGSPGQRLSERYHSELARATTLSFTPSLLAGEVAWRLRGLRGWRLALARNAWFGHRAAAAVRQMAVDQAPVTVFSHSYVALEPFRIAKARGFKTVLGQIDPGEEHFALVERLEGSWPEWGPAPESPPPEYFAKWRQECDLADLIVVNSEWSRTLLEQAGIDRDKLRVIPLPFEPEPHPRFYRAYPSAFSAGHPLELLFVGSAAVSKGLPSMLNALDLLDDVPVRLTLVGEVLAEVPARYRSHPAIRWVGPVSRGDVMPYYRDSHVLLFPSHSDGFGMTQVEAQGWELPIIASRCCGRVVEHGVNGLVLDEVSAPAIAAAIRTVASSPALLMRFSQAAGTAGIDVADLGMALLKLEAA